jgi:hypothetical protein
MSFQNLGARGYQKSRCAVATSLYKSVSRADDDAGALRSLSWSGRIMQTASG